MKQFLPSTYGRQLKAGAGIILLALIGYVLTTTLHASAILADAEAEDGQLAGRAATVNDTNASNGHAVKFGGPVSGTDDCQDPQWTSSEPFGTWEHNGFNVNNNIWNTEEAGPQTIYACDYNNWYIVTDQPGTGTDDSVKTYADTQKHVEIPLSSMTAIPSSFDVTTPDGGGTVTPDSKQWNAAYDLWLDDFGTEVMVWNNWTMNWQHWYDTYGGEVANIDGVPYYAYHNGDGGLWFVRQTVTNQGSVDLASVLRWALGKGWLSNSQVLNEIEYGFEICYTGTPTTFTLNDFSVATD